MDGSSGTLTAIFSALAAGFAAVVAVLMWSSRVLALHDSVQPEPVLTDWESRPAHDPYIDGIVLQGIRSFGNGSALLRPLVVDHPTLEHSRVVQHRLAVLGILLGQRL